MQGGWTALTSAAYYGHAECVELLLQHMDRRGVMLKDCVRIHTILSHSIDPLVHARSRGQTMYFFLSFVTLVTAFEMKMGSVRSEHISSDERVSNVHALIYFEGAQLRRRFDECMCLARFCDIRAIRSTCVVR